jgi:hypothetical protein
MTIYLRRLPGVRANELKPNYVTRNCGLVHSISSGPLHHGVSSIHFRVDLLQLEFVSSVSNWSIHFPVAFYHFLAIQFNIELVSLISACPSNRVGPSNFRPFRSDSTWFVKYRADIIVFRTILLNYQRGYLTSSGFAQLPVSSSHFVF